MADPMTLTASIIKTAIPAEGTIEERARAAFVAAHAQGTGWMLSSDDQRFKAGAAALYLVANEEDRTRIKHELDMLAALSAAQSGIPVDFGAMLGGEDPPKPIGLLGIFREVAAAPR